MLPVLLHKALGQIPLYLAREHGWACEFAFVQAEDEPLIYPTDYTDYVMVRRLAVTASRQLKLATILAHVVRRARLTDVLLLYHFTPETLLYATAYKAMNPNGITLLKLDMDRRGLAAFESPQSLKQRGLVRLLKSAPLDIVTIETQRMLRSLAPQFRRMKINLKYLPVGFAGHEIIDIDRMLAAKENIILTVGRLGIPQKNNQLLLDAMIDLGPEKLANWSVVMAGTRTPQFEEIIASFRRENPKLAERLVVHDFIADREALYDLYRRARVYCLTSHWESFATVLAEASFFGCYPVSTDVGAAYDLTQGGRYGTLLREGDRTLLSGALHRIIDGEIDTSDAGKRLHDRVLNSFTWSHVADRVSEEVAVCRDERSP